MDEPEEKNRIHSGGCSSKTAAVAPPPSGRRQRRAKTKANYTCGQTKYDASEGRTLNWR